IIEKRRSSYILKKVDTHPDYERWGTVTAMRDAELRHMQDYTRHEGCLMHFIAATLDDPHPPEQCGRCKNCTGVTSKFQPDPKEIHRAQLFLRNGNPLTFQPRKRWVKDLPGITKTTDIQINETGLALCHLYDSVYGIQVRNSRATYQPYSDDIVNASTDLLRQYFKNLPALPDVIVPVPSLRSPALVSDFAVRLAQNMNLPAVHTIQHHTQHLPQSQMNNSYQQANNVLGCFSADNRLHNQVVLLVDDIADSRWTLTVLGDLLQRHGVASVYPFVIAVTNITD
ncbi:MAG: phosphoribosyltransferase family protein, partial [Aggregatilineales bacterium]